MRAHRFALAWAGTVALGLALAPTVAQAGKNDLQFLNLCKYAPPGTLSGAVSECSWVKRDSNGLIKSFEFDADAESRYRSLMSELGVVMAPRLQTPADTLGFAGFQLTAEIGWTQISNNKTFWNGVEGVPVENPTSRRPSSWLTTVGAYVRKGLWLPLPAFEIGGGALNLLDSRMWALQAYAKVALHEGFHDWPIPSVSARFSGSRVTGTDQVTLSILGFDAMISKQASLGGTARIEPYVGWNYLYIDARSQVIDATPSCDAYALRQLSPGMSVSNHCAAAQAGSWDDLRANFVFPNQDPITRGRLFVGAKLKLAELTLVTQYELTSAGSSRDERKANGAKDGSGTQQGFTLSAGFDF